MVAQRTYSAPDREILDAYREQLYGGKWYVDCSAGGAQYGQGMYCAADWDAKVLTNRRGETMVRVSAGIREEMAHYRELGRARGNGEAYVETLTLDPSAKVVTFDAIQSEKTMAHSRRAWEVRDERLRREIEARELTGERARYVTDKITHPNDRPDPGSLTREERYDLDEFARHVNDLVRGDQDRDERARELREMDLGQYAALRGYDAINAEGHGQSGSYTVIRFGAVSI